MAVSKPTIPKGTRDFSPHEMVRRNFIFGVIREIFQLFGYQPLETPAMENLSTLMGKYGEEGDKLLFRILNSGDFMSEVRAPAAPSGENTGISLDHKTLAPYIAEKGLRYDLTVPFARFVVQHQHELVFPFKRYQIQPVWRADRPQKGRYREFFQCDVDVIGSNSLMNEVELVQIIDRVFEKLGIRVLIRINNRKVLAGIAEAVGFPEMLTDITVAMDKLDKIGLDKVNDELKERGLSVDAISKLQPVLNIEGKIKDKFELLGTLFSGSTTGKKGLEELHTVLTIIKGLNLVNKFDFDTRLARGLSYYTGTIIEVRALDAAIGSICGGGRYDDLTGIFGLPGMSGVGISFGADRIYDVMNELNLFPQELVSSTRILFINFGPDEEKHCLGLVSELRKSTVPAEIYPDQVKIKKQMEYANRKNIPFVVLIGKDEMEKGIMTIKNMQSGEQQSGTFEELKKIVSW